MGLDGVRQSLALPCQPRGPGPQAGQSVLVGQALVHHGKQRPQPPQLARRRQLRRARCLPARRAPWQPAAPLPRHAPWPRPHVLPAHRPRPRPGAVRQGSRPCGAVTACAAVASRAEAAASASAFRRSAAASFSRLPFAGQFLHHAALRIPGAGPHTPQPRRPARRPGPTRRIRASRADHGAAGIRGAAHVQVQCRCLGVGPSPRSAPACRCGPQLPWRLRRP